jgi:2-polyprenyl-3-methyl-5-hydroxy-6-metoxy-1,4-benzoquinol methylase
MISVFERDYFEGETFQKWGNYENLVQRNLWKLKKLKAIVVQYAPPRHKTLLDIGCALGHFASLLQTNFDVAGMDISEYAIMRAKKRLKAPFAQGNVEERIPFDRQFDVITAIDILEHLHSPQAALTNIYEHLRPGGLFFFETPTITNWMSQLFNKYIFARDKTHVFVKKIEEIDQLLTGCRFKQITYYSTLLPFFFRTDLIVRSLSNVLGIYQKPVK